MIQFDDLSTIVTNPGWYLLRAGRAAVTAGAQGEGGFTYAIWHTSGQSHLLGAATADIIEALPGFDPQRKVWVIAPTRGSGEDKGGSRG